LPLRCFAFLQGIVYRSRDKALWFDNLWGTPTAPIVVQRAPGMTGEADLQGIEVFECTWLYFIGITFRQVGGCGVGCKVQWFIHCYNSCDRDRLVAALLSSCAACMISRCFREQRHRIAHGSISLT
jgi:hypothetical protein